MASKTTEQREIDSWEAELDASKSEDLHTTDQGFWEVFLADEYETDPLPEPGDFFDSNGQPLE